MLDPQIRIAPTFDNQFPRDVNFPGRVGGDARVHAAVYGGEAFDYEQAEKLRTSLLDLKTTAGTD